MGIYARWKAKLNQARTIEAYHRQVVKNAKGNLAKAVTDRKFAERVVARHKPASPQAKALKWARAQVGTVEQPAGSNSGPKITDWQKLVETFPGEMRGASWCGAFTYAALRHAGVRGLSWRMRYVPYIVEDAKAAKNGLEKLVPWHERKPGDLVIFNFDGGAVDHVGLYVEDVNSQEIRTIEGNTSSGSAGSQSNGGGVFVRVRDRRLVAYLARPRYN